MNSSGAIKESFSDIWGEFIDQTNGRGTDTTNILCDTSGRSPPIPQSCDWLIGEDCISGVARSMSNPTLFGHPDRLQSPNYLNRSNDNGGVHTNNGVGNKLAYLLTDGDTFRGFIVFGMGWKRIAKLYYAVITSDRLGEYITYPELYRNLRLAALDQNWTIREINNFFRAARAVEIITGQRNIYVDQECSESAPETGDKDCVAPAMGPYKTINWAMSNLLPGDRLFIKSGSYNEKITFDRITEVKALDGNVTIGK